MVDILTEDRVTFTELAREIGVSIPTVWRWAQRGVGGVILECYAEGGRRYTSRQAHRRFVEGCTANIKGAPLDVRTNRQREAAIQRAEAALDKAGV